MSATWLASGASTEGVTVEAEREMGLSAASRGRGGSVLVVYLSTAELCMSRLPLGAAAILCARDDVRGTDNGHITSV